MTAAEKILTMMRKQGAYYNGEGIQLATVKGGKVVVGTLKLERKNYMKAEGLNFANGDTLVVYRYSDELYLVLAKVV